MSSSGVFTVQQAVGGGMYMHFVSALCFRGFICVEHALRSVVILRSMPCRSNDTT